MSREEAINRLKTDVYKYADFSENPNENEFWDALDMAITALEQEPCEPVGNSDKLDCISRQAVIDCFKKWQPYMGTRMWEFEKELKELPSVKPQESKTEHWIVEIWNNREHHTCSECNRVVGYEPCYHYCPNCGAKMEV